MEHKGCKPAIKVLIKGTDTLYRCSKSSLSQNNIEVNGLLRSLCSKLIPSTQDGQRFLIIPHYQFKCLISSSGNLSLHTEEKSTSGCLVPWKQVRWSLSSLVRRAWCLWILKEFQILICLTTKSFSTLLVLHARASATVWEWHSKQCFWAPAVMSMTESDLFIMQRCLRNKDHQRWTFSLVLCTQRFLLRLWYDEL